MQYTIPKEEKIEKVKQSIKELTTKEKHLRRCYVVAKEGADKKEIEKEIKEMPYYFEEYQTEVNFISKEEMKEHKKMPHGGLVIRHGKTNKNKHIIEYKLKLDSNPEFTASVLVAFARATYILNKNKDYGAKTVIDIPPFMLSVKKREELIKEL